MPSISDDSLNGDCVGNPSHRPPLLDSSEDSGDLSTHTNEVGERKHNKDAAESTGRANAEHRTRPRLMYVLGLAPQKIGGLEKFLRHFVIALDVAGWDSILCFDGPIAAEFREYISSPNVAIESLNNQGNLGLGCAGELWRLLRKYKPQTFVYAFHGVMRLHTGHFAAFERISLI